MGQVAITLNSRTYRLVCGDGEEDHLANLAGIVKSKIEALRADVGNVGDERLMLMAALLIADELVEARAAARRSDTFDRTSHSEQETAILAGETDVQSLRAVAARMASATKNRDGTGSSTAEAAGKSAPQSATHVQRSATARRTS